MVDKDSNPFDEMKKALADVGCISLTLLIVGYDKQGFLAMNPWKADEIIRIPYEAKKNEQ